MECTVFHYRKLREINDYLSEYELAKVTDVNIEDSGERKILRVRKFITPMKDMEIDGTVTVTKDVNGKIHIITSDCGGYDSIFLPIEDVVAFLSTGTIKGESWPQR